MSDGSGRWYIKHGAVAGTITDRYSNTHETRPVFSIPSREELWESHNTNWHALQRLTREAFKTGHWPPPVSCT